MDYRNGLAGAADLIAVKGWCQTPLTADRLSRNLRVDNRDEAMLCQDWSLVKRERQATTVHPLYCRCWHCQECGPKRRRQLLAKAVNGNPTSFLTLTVNPARGDTPADRARMLAEAWSKLVKRIVRRLNGRKIEYLAVFEATKAGEPHLHLLMRAPYIHQRWISAQMRDLIDAPIADIRKVDSPGRAARYLAKYIGKAPHRFGTRKRYWSSRNWTPPWSRDDDDDDDDRPEISIVKRPAADLVRGLIKEGWRLIATEGAAFIFEPRWQ